ncbi:MAG: DUF4136 domain-containing protein [Bacteroidales bacterium]|nr:DUF4136 domain-containing protein [Bacteroidales bacterium]
MKKGISFVLFILSIIILWGCYPQGPEYVEDLDVVLTSHEEEYDFAGKATYAMPDKIVKITGDLSEGDDPAYIPDVTAQKILATIATNMANLGWVRVDVDDLPDMMLLPAAWEVTTVYYYYDYWYWWYGGYYPPWGYGPPVYYSSYSTGTLFMALIDPDIVESTGNPVRQWSGGINGLLTGTYDATRVTTAINKAFAISPYLKTN